MKRILAAYERLGWRLTPCGNGNGKAPWNTSWQSDALTKGAAETHLKQGGTVALVLGPGSGVVDLETDSPQGEREVSALFDGAVPRGPIWRSKRGKHRLFRFDPRLSTLGKSVIHVGGVEVRGCDNGACCSILPPSIVDGVKREWIVPPGKAPIPSLPEPVVAKLLRANTLGASLSAKDGEKIREGHRNTFLASLAGSMRRAGMGEAKIEEELLAVNQRCCDPPLPVDEVAAIARSIAKYEPAPLFTLSKLSTHALPVLDPQALIGLPGEIVTGIDPFTEAASVAVLLNLLVSFGVAAGDSSHCEVQNDLHPARLYAILVGSTSQSRKGLSWSSVKRLWELAERDWLKTQVENGLSTGEGLIARLDESKQKNVLILEEEYGRVLTVAHRPENTLSAVLRNAWDRGTLSVMTRNNRLRSDGNHVGLIGHITAEELTSLMGGVSMANGFGNRHLFALVQRSKLLPDGARPPEKMMQEFAKNLKKALFFARQRRVVNRDDEARELWHDVYGKLGDTTNRVLDALTSRADPQVVRLSLAYSLLDRSTVITLKHLEAAIALWGYCRESVHSIFAKSTGDPNADRILAMLAGAPMTGDEIYHAFSGHLHKVDRERALSLLMAQGLVRGEKIKTRGKPRTIYSLI
jgi:hypothetical protein